MSLIKKRGGYDEFQGPVATLHIRILAMMQRGSYDVSLLLEGVECGYRKIMRGCLLRRFDRSLLIINARKLACTIREILCIHDGVNVSDRGMRTGSRSNAVETHT